MRAYVALAGTALAGTVMLLSSRGVALAVDWYTGASVPVPKEDWLVAVDSSVSFTSTGSTFGRVAATGAISNTLTVSGLRYRIEGGGGTFNYTSGVTNSQVDGTQVYGSLLGGYEKVWNGGNVAGYLGVDARNTSLSVPDPGNPTVGTSVGIKAVAEFYLKPWDRTVFSGIASYATNHNSFYGSLRAGYEAFGYGYLGPEIAVLGDTSFSQLRLGAHYATHKIHGVQFGVGAGIVSDSRTHGGVYGTLSARFGF